MASIISAGTTSGTALNMTADTTGALQLATNSGTTAVTIDTSQNVGIGTTSPSEKFVTYTSSGYVAMSLYTGANNIRMYANGTDTGIQSVTSGNTLGFQTNSGSGATERMRIDSSGNVGIGTSSPLNFGGYTTITLNNATNGGVYAINNNGTNVAQFFGSGSSIGLYGVTAIPMIFSTNSTERMRIDSAGNVLVSTNTLYGYQAAPTSKAAATTLTGAELIVGILNTTGTSYTITLPTGTNIDAAVSTSLAANGFFDWWVINTASGTVTIGANGNTTMGTLTVATGVSAQFRFRKTAANTYTVYRLG
jgi:hypothetical protein